jgi:Sigma-70 region 2
VLNSANEFPIIDSSDGQAIAETIAAAQNGDEAAFSILFETYKARICTYLAHLIGNEEEGRDLAQDTFLKAWRAFPQTTKELQFEAWLYRIATNTALDYLRSQKLRGLLWNGPCLDFSLVVSPLSFNIIWLRPSYSYGHDGHAKFGCIIYWYPRRTVNECLLSHDSHTRATKQRAHFRLLHFNADEGKLQWVPRQLETYLLHRGES